MNSLKAGPAFTELFEGLINARDALPDGGRLLIESSNVIIGDDEVAGVAVGVEGGDAVPDPGHPRWDEILLLALRFLAREHTAAGGDQPHNNMMPYMTYYFNIALQGVFPPRT